MVTDKQLKEIAKSLIGNVYDFDSIGLRIQESDYGLKIGDQINHISRHWVDGEMTEKDTDGICAVSLKVLDECNPRFGAYSGSVILVIGSNRSSSGEDDGEIILHQSCGEYPTVLGIIYL